ncbi:hypothetical protein PUN28_015671 [Cardiocondyla obscurior]|uniref:Uncharacterized protein n=1 Tax=Cardiocondyla obscurior TaxID=286306 RepID=A0AAW2EY07_9HYME
MKCIELRETENSSRTNNKLKEKIPQSIDREIPQCSLSVQRQLSRAEKKKRKKNKAIKGIHFFTFPCRNIRICVTSKTSRHENYLLLLFLRARRARVITSPFLKVSYILTLVPAEPTWRDHGLAFIRYEIRKMRAIMASQLSRTRLVIY